MDSTSAVLVERIARAVASEMVSSEIFHGGGGGSVMGVGGLPSKGPAEAVAGGAG
jgi:hypothetical protein